MKTATAKKTRKPRSDKGKPRRPYKNTTEQTTTTEQTAPPINEPNPTPTPKTEKNNSIEELFNTDDIFKEFTAYEPPSEDSEKTEKTTKAKAAAEKDGNAETADDDDWLEDEDEADEDEDYDNNNDQETWIKYAISTIEKVDKIRALGLSFWSGESSSKYIEFKNLKETDTLVLEVAEVMQKYKAEMKPEYSIAISFIVGTVILVSQAREDRERNKAKKGKV